MPPYRANLGGAFGSGYFPRPVQQIDVGGAISAIGREATSLINSAYLRKVAEANNAARAKQESQARMRQERLDADNLRLREADLELRRQSAERAALPTAVMRPDGSIVIVDRSQLASQMTTAPAAPPMPAAGDAAMTPAAPMTASTPAPMTAPPAPVAPPSGPRLVTPGVRVVPGALPRLNVPQGGQMVTPAQEAEGAAWYAQNRRNPDVVTAVGVVQRNNPALTEGQAAYLARATNQGLSPKPLPAPKAPAAATPPRAPTEAQEKSYFYLGMMDESLPIINELSSRVRGDRISFALSPAVPNAVGNRALSAEEQQLINAARVFATGILRKESGAAITDAEVRDTFQKYIPLSGDSEQVKAQKTANRTAAIRLLRDLAAPATLYYDAVRGGQPVTNEPTPLPAYLLPVPPQ